MTNAERGIATNQHSQRDQQAVMFRGCCEAMEEMERAKPVTRLELHHRLMFGDALMRLYIADVLSAMFVYSKRIDILRITNLAPWQDAATAALKRQADEAAVFHCDICGAASGTCECAWTDTEAEREGERRGDEERER